MVPIRKQRNAPVVPLPYREGEINTRPLLSTEAGLSGLGVRETP